jgi:hypothetical protein
MEYDCGRLITELMDAMMKMDKNGKKLGGKKNPHRRTNANFSGVVPFFGKYSIYQWVLKCMLQSPL